MRTSARLAVMMFLQYAVRGIWLSIIPKYFSSPPAAGGLGFSGGQVGWILGLGSAVGAISAPFIAGQIADRYLNAELALAILIFISGILTWAMAYVTNYSQFLWLSVFSSIAFVPTYPLSNGIALGHLNEPERKFPLIRAWGTAGFVIAAVLFGVLWLRAENEIVNTAHIVDALKISGMLSMIYALFALTMLPPTPPKKSRAHPLAFARAFALLARPDFAVLTIVGLLMSMIHQAYYFRGPTYFIDVIHIKEKWLAAVMGIGQMSEFFCLLALGTVLKRIGYGRVFAIAGVAYVLRFAVFWLEKPAAAVIAVQALHGINYAFFFAASFIYVEKIAAADIRHSAQSVFSLVVLGVGPILAGIYNEHFDRFAGYREFWLMQTIVAAIGTAILLLAFRAKRVT